MTENGVAYFHLIPLTKKIQKVRKIRTFYSPDLKYGNSTYISVVSAGKWLGIWVSFLFRQSAIPSEHLQGVGQVQDAKGKHSETSISSSLPKSKIRLLQILSIKNNYSFSLFTGFKNSEHLRPQN